MDVRFFEPCSKKLFLDYKTLTFTEYQAACQNHILSCHQGNFDKNLLLLNSPFDWKPTHHVRSTGILLLHGLLDSPLAMQDLGKSFLRENYWVRSVLLPGHGTKPGDLLSYGLEDWLLTVKFAIECFLKEVDELYLVGFSGGASLAIYHALFEPKVKAVVALAPSLRLKHKAAKLTGFVNTYANARKQVYWPLKQDKFSLARYHNYPIHFAHEAYALTKLLRETLVFKNFNKPMLMNLTIDDETISSQTAINYFKRFSNDQNELIVYAAQKTKDEGKIEYRNSFLPDERVLNFSHICLPIRTDNPYYGIHNTEHETIYEPFRKTRDRTIYKGALNFKNRLTHRLQRLTYNPDFEYLSERILTFIDA